MSVVLHKEISLTWALSLGSHAVARAHEGHVPLTSVAATPCSEKFLCVIRKPHKLSLAKRQGTPPIVAVEPIPFPESKQRDGGNISEVLSIREANY